MAHLQYFVLQIACAGVATVACTAAAVPGVGLALERAKYLGCTGPEADTGLATGARDLCGGHPKYCVGAFEQGLWECIDYAEVGGAGKWESQETGDPS